MTRPSPRRVDRSDEPAPDFLDERWVGDLQVGAYAYTWLFEKGRKLPKRKQPFGFQLPKEAR